MLKFIRSGANYKITRHEKEQESVTRDKEMQK